MPIYEFKCSNDKCKHTFDKLFIGGESDEEKEYQLCPKCGAIAKRVISGGAQFKFKGKGFYSTDY